MAAEPVRVEGPPVIQGSAAIDTREHYTVRWECFDNEGALYIVTQGEHTIFVSTRAPDAERILKGALSVANYPCVEWPNFDL
jgi:hypothetical protein